MTEPTKREIAADLRAGKGHYTLLAGNTFASRIYGIRKNRDGIVSVRISFHPETWVPLASGATIYSDRDTYTV